MSLLRLTCGLFLLCMSVGFAQNQRPITHQDYAAWEGVDESTLSRQGTWAAITVSPQQGDPRVVLAPPTGSAQLILQRASHPAFTASEKFVAMSIHPAYDTVRAKKLAEVAKKDMPHDSLAVVSLADLTVVKVGHVQSFAIPPKGGDWLAYLYEEGYPETPEDSTDDDLPGQTLVIQNLANQTTYTLNRVSGYAWAHEGTRLAAIRKPSADSVQDGGVYVFDVKNLAFTAVDEGWETYQGLTWDEPGTQLAYLATPDSAEADRRAFTLKYWSPRGGLVSLVDANTPGMPEAWWVSEHGSLNFSKNGTRLFLGTRPQPVKYAYEEDSTLLEEDRPGLDIWNWQDVRLMPQQLLEAKDDEKKSYTAVWWIKEGKLVQLATPEIPEVEGDEHRNSTVWVGQDRSPYQRSYSWAYPWAHDVYSVDLATGAKRLIYQGATDNAKLSPGGRYVAWFEISADSNWMVYDLKDQVLRQPSDGIPHPLWDELNDRPMLPNPYGAAGWVEDDEALWIYDRYDIWSLDPTGKNGPVNVTQGQGRRHQRELRLAELNWNDAAYAIPKRQEVLLNSYHEETKEYGIYALGSRRNALVRRVEGPYRYHRVQKAPESTRSVVFVRESFEESPNLYGTAWDFADVKKLTNLNPQQAELLWGTAELMHFTSLQGDALDGVLYKPANFDPSKQYPMIVYFYERLSQTMYAHMNPRPSSSTINIPWAVSNGYLVLVPDITYQIGAPGPSAYDCIVPATQAVIAQGFVKEDAIGLQGQSWGGYQTAYLVTRTNLYACASAGAIVSNMTSAYGGIRWGSGLSRAFQYEHTQSRLGGSLWESPREYIENSPLFFADRVRTPLLLMHNDEDSAVPWYQGIEMFNALRRLNQPVWMLVYNGEPHNLRQWRNRMDLSMRMGQFFDVYLKGAPMPLWMESGIPATDKGRYLGYGTTQEEEKQD